MPSFQEPGAGSVCLFKEPELPTQEALLRKKIFEYSICNGLTKNEMIEFHTLEYKIKTWISSDNEKEKYFYYLNLQRYFINYSSAISVAVVAERSWKEIKQLLSTIESIEKGCIKEDTSKFQEEIESYQGVDWSVVDKSMFEWIARVLEKEEHKLKEYFSLLSEAKRVYTYLWLMSRDIEVVLQAT